MLDAATLLLLAGGAALMAALLARELPGAVGTMRLVVGGLGSGLCLVAAVQAYVRWRLVGDGVAARVGVALTVYGTTVAPLAATGEDGPTGTIGQTVGTATVVLALAAATQSPTVDAGFRFLRRTLALVAVPLAAVLAAAAAPTLADRLVGTRLAGWPALELCGAAAVVVTAGVLTAGALRRGRRLLARLALAQVVLVAVPIVARADPEQAPTQLIALTILVSAIALVLRTATADVRLAFGTVGVRDDGLVRRWQDAATRAERVTRADSERTHEIRSALLAIEGASAVLSRHVEDLGAVQDAELASALHRETARLQQLLAANRGPEGATYRPLEVLEPLVIARRASGQRIALDVPAQLRATGRPHALAEAMTNLLSNAAAHAPGSAVRIAALPTPGDGRIVLEVTDTGPGFGPEELAHALERGWRGARSTAPGQGIGLPLAAHLVEQEGGSLALGPPGPDRGALVTIVLPSAPPTLDRRFAASEP